MGQTGLSRRILAGITLAGGLIWAPALSGQDAPVAPSAAAPVIDGWGNFKFGMTMEQASAAAPTMPFGNPCTKEQLAKNGCLLPASKQVTIVGLPFAPTLHFDRFDRLYEISLSYDETNMPISTCTAYFARVIDALETQYGVLRSTSSFRSANWKGTMHKSAAGTEYALSETPGNIIDGYLSTDTEAYWKASANFNSRLDLRAARPFLSVSTLIYSQKRQCYINARYTAATMPQMDKGASSADNAKF